MGSGLSVVGDISGNTGIHWHVDISHGAGISANVPPPTPTPPLPRVEGLPRG